METTVKVEINCVYEGYEYTGCRRCDISKERTWRVEPWIGTIKCPLRCKTYEELQDKVLKMYNLTLPPRRDLHFKNYGAPYNEAEV